MILYDEVQNPGLFLFGRPENDRDELLSICISAKSVNALQSCPRLQKADLLVLLNGAENQNGSWGHCKDPVWKLRPMFINLLFAEEKRRFSWVYKDAKIVGLSQMKSADDIHVVVKKKHFVDEFWNELDQWEKFVADLPTPFADNFVEKISPVGQTN